MCMCVCMCVCVYFVFFCSRWDGQVEERTGRFVCLTVMSPGGRESWLFFFDEDREQGQKKKRGRRRGGEALAWDSLVGT